MERANLIVPEQREERPKVVPRARDFEKTYYYWQRRVFTTLTAQEPYFAEVPVMTKPVKQAVVATLRLGGMEADIYTGADAAAIEMLCRALKSC